MAVWPKGLVTAASVVVSVAACGSAPANLAARQGDRIAVVASTDVWASVAAAVGADLITVKPIVAGQAGDPHSYQVNAKDAAELRAAELVVFNGGGYDDFVEESLGEGGPQRIKAVDLKPEPRTPEEENEHVWYDLPTVSMVADELAKRFGELRPSARTTFDANADAFNAKLDGLQAEVDELAHAGTAVAATEPVAHYLLAAAKLVDATPHEFVDAIEAEADPPAAAVAEIRQLVAERRVAVLVHNPQTDTPMVADLAAKARAAGLPVVEMTETLPEGQDYVTWMGTQIQALSGALGRP